MLTGVTGLAELVAARPEERPTYVGLDLRALHEPQPAPESEARRGCSAGGERRSTTAALGSTGTASAADWWRVGGRGGWAALDAAGEAAHLGARAARVA